MAISKKKKAIIVLSIALIAAIGINGTYAYLISRTKTLENNFGFSYYEISGKLTEPEWDGVIEYDYDDSRNIYPVYGYTSDGKKIYGYTNGDITKPVTQRSSITGSTSRPATDNEGNSIVYGIDESKKMIPGHSAGKNPMITNTTELATEWAAIKMTYVYSEGEKKGKPLSAEDLSAIKKVIDIDYNVDKYETTYNVSLSGEVTTSEQLVSEGDWVRIVPDALDDGSMKPKYIKKHTSTTVKLNSDGEEQETVKVTENKWSAGSGNELEDDGVSQIFFYKGKLVPSESTVPLFTKVSVNKWAGKDMINEVNGNKFTIYIEGYIAEGSVASDIESFIEWGASGGNVRFRNTPSAEHAVDIDSNNGILAADPIE